PIVIQENAAFKRDRFVEYLEKSGVETRNLFSSMPTQCSGFRFLGYKTGDFPNSEYVGDNGIHIGVHQDLGKQECDYFLGTVEEFLSENTQKKRKTLSLGVYSSDQPCSQDQ
ncbi:MAG: DegT/DnrJ/EryC1/StrS family aminotransferase, partial [Planctomycetota bacterium]